MDKITVTDTETHTVIFDSAWPVVTVASFDALLEMGDDDAAYEDGKMTAADFTAKWGIHPDSDYSLTVKTGD